MRIMMGMCDVDAGYMRRGDDGVVWGGTSSIYEGSLRILGVGMLSRNEAPGLGIKDCSCQPIRVV